MKAKELDELKDRLRDRFERNKGRHEGIEWEEVLARLVENPGKMRALRAMEESGGEPDVIGRDEKTGAIIFFDCSPESPVGRRSLCYDREALDSRKANKPAGSVLETASSMGVELLTEEEYAQLQGLGEFDLKTSSWIHAPARIRALGGALFGDRRYGRVFTYHNGAESYYSARGFRGRLSV